MKHLIFNFKPVKLSASASYFENVASDIARVDGATVDAQFDVCEISYSGGVPYTPVNGGAVRHRGQCITIAATVAQTPQDGDLVNFDGTPAYAGVSVISGAGAGLYVYRGTGTVGWVKLN